jgi:hypothetical protein
MLREILQCEADVDSRPTATIPALTDLDRRRRERRLKTALKRPGVWVTTFLTRRKLYPPTTERSTR